MAVPKQGIKLSYLGDFVRENGGVSKFQDLTTLDVCTNIIKPKTLASKLSYCEWLIGNHPIAEIVKPANVFISHAWLYKFLDVINALQDHFKDLLQETIVWIDIFSVNQHITANNPPEWWANEFKSAIESFGHTVIVFAPWNNPAPLTRGWCIWELYCTIATNISFDIAMAEDQRSMFFDDMDNSGFKAIEKMFIEVDCENSKCYYDADRDRIHEAIRQTVGFNELNSMVFKKMREWVISVTHQAIKKQPYNSEKADNLKFILAQLYSGLGNYFRAGRLLHDILLKYLNEQKSPDRILELISHLIHALGPQKEKFDEMIQIFALAQSLSSKFNIPIYGIKGNIASFYIEAGKTDLAQSLLEECIDACTNNFSDAYVSKNTFLTFQLNLSIIYSDKRLFQKSEELTLKIMDQCEKDIEFGKKHSIYLTCLDHLGNLYTTWKSSSISINQVELVEGYYKQAYELTKVTYGEKHPTTLTKLHNLANHYLNKGDFITAEKLFHEYLDIAVQEFGKRDTRFRVALRKLMILYKQQQREDLVTELYQKYELYHSEL